MTEKLPERLAIDVKNWRKGNEPENPWTTATVTTPTENWNPDIFAYYVPEQSLARAVAEASRQTELEVRHMVLKEADAYPMLIKAKISSAEEDLRKFYRDAHAGAAGEVKP